MSFFKALFGGKPSVEDKAAEFSKNIAKATAAGNFKKLEKLEAEYDEWFDSLSETDQKKAIDAFEKIMTDKIASL
jgi:uncharacterized membrane protein (DUF106 family)